VARLGVQYVQCGNDYGYMLRFCDQLYAEIREKYRS